MDVTQYFSEHQLYSIHKITWKGRNGELEGLVRFDGFDNKKPKLIQSGNTPLDIEQIGKILSISEEFPDGYCVR